jgi:hypothetical protein
MLEITTKKTNNLKVHVKRALTAAHVAKAALGTKDEDRSHLVISDKQKRNYKLTKTMRKELQADKKHNLSAKQKDDRVNSGYAFIYSFMSRCEYMGAPN